MLWRISDFDICSDTFCLFSFTFLLANFYSLLGQLEEGHQHNCISPYFPSDHSPNTKISMLLGCLSFLYALSVHHCVFPVRIKECVGVYYCSHWVRDRNSPWTTTHTRICTQLLMRNSNLHRGTCAYHCTTLDLLRLKFWSLVPSVLKRTSGQVPMLFFFFQILLSLPTNYFHINIISFLWQTNK